MKSWTDLFRTGLAASDTEVYSLIEEQRQLTRTSVNLVASESYAPQATLEAEVSTLINKNAAGYPPRVTVGGGRMIDAIESLALARAKQLFGAEHANVQSLSSTIANVAVVRALLKTGDRILAFDPNAGGHSSHGSSGHLAGQDYQVKTFGVDEATGALDLDTARRLAREFRPTMLIAGSSHYPKQIDFAALADIASEVGALTFADIAHVAGLIVAGLHPNPTPRYDVVTTSTHKTLCGPRTGGLILCKQVHGSAIDRALAPGLQAAPGAHIIAARAVLFRLVKSPAFTELMRATLDNAAVLADALRAGGVRLYAGGTDTHMVVADLRDTDWSAKDLNEHLLRHNVIASASSLPRRSSSVKRLGLRVGSVAMTICGADRDAFVCIGAAVAKIIKARSSLVDPDLARNLREIADAYPPPVD
jgi:glycine hydroxymethyltransferase